LINHQANFKALKDLGVKEVIGINSTGSLKRKLRPGTIVVPNDFIGFTATSTTAYGKPIHITPVISEEIRKKLIKAANECGVKAVNGGVYWQTPGPRLETKAEIAMMSRFADLVGMTMASEAAVAQELDLAYAALCSVDNYGHGLGEKELTIDEIVTHARKNANIIVKVVARYLERRR
jgi:5'-methylthioadenosine phosphorylase